MSETNESAARRQADADAEDAARQITEATDRVAAQLTATQEDLVRAQQANETLAAQVEALTTQLAESTEALATTQREAAGLQQKVDELSAAVTLPRTLPGDDELHERWCALGGAHGDFEQAKQLVQTLL